MNFSSAMSYMTLRSRLESSDLEGNTRGKNYGSNSTVNSHKRSVYEPQGVEKCRQIVCSQRKAIVIVVGMMLFIFIIALIASLARPAAPLCADNEPKEHDKTEPKKKFLATDGSVFPWKDIRLPTAFVPQAYDIHLQPNLTSFHFVGQVDIILQVTTEIHYIVFHSKNLSLKSFDLFVTGKNSKVDIKKNKEYLAHEQIYLKLASTLKPKQNYTLRIKYEGDLSSDMTGFYKSSYKTSAGENRWLATTHFEPTDARKAFPCFDEPELKASFKMSIVREAKHISLFNTPITKTVERADGYREDQFEESVKMSTYLVAFVVCDYAKLTNTTETGIKVSVYAPEELIGQASFALEAAVNILPYYEEFFGVPYPMPKQDLIAIPDFAAGAMENWGLITYRMTALLYDPQESAVSNKQWVAVVVAHELAHQWFGNLVTMRWWNDLWLNEGFASFVEYLGTDKLEPSWMMLDQFVPEALVAGLRSDSLSSSHPISVSVQDPAEINEIFDQISYDKGSSIIRMLESFIGRGVLQEGLRYYLDKHKFKNAETDDLWAAMSEKARGADIDVSVKEVMDTWTRQMGYPFIKVTRQGGKVKVTQKRFLLNPRGTKSEEFKSPYNYKWHVPLNYITSDDPKSASDTIWLRKAAASFSVPGNPAWIKLNVNMTGFYRVCYDDNDWQAIISQLRRDHEVFSPADRASFLDDAFALAGAGEIDITVALDITKYLVNEKEYVPWSVALMNLNTIKQLLVEKPAYKYYADYVKKLISERVRDVGWSDEGEHLQKYLRALILRAAVQLNDEASVAKAMEKYKDWMHNGVQIPPNLKNVVYSAGIMYGGEAEWQFAWNKYKESSVPSEKNKLMHALSTTTDSLRLNRYLHMSLDLEEIRKGDTVSVVSHVAGNPAGKVLAWRFVKQNWQEFSDRYSGGSFDMSNLVVRTASRFTTQYDYDEVKAFYEVHEAGSGKRAVSQALESIEMNIDWLENNEQQCVQWLRREANAKMRRDVAEL